MRRLAAITLILLALASPALGEAGYAACVWGLSRDESPDAHLLDWRSCVPDGGEDACGEWHVVALKAPEGRHADSVTLRKDWEAEDRERHPGLMPGRMRFEILYAPRPGETDNGVRMLVPVRDLPPGDACASDIPKAHFVATQAGIEMREGCKPGVDGCAIGGVEPRGPMPQGR